ncbi:MAG: tRNA pseudouridine(38-40) synthase TruA [Actinomycetota bacterium]
MTSTSSQNAALTVAYHGGAFRGFAENPDVRTVMGELRAATERVVGAPVEFTGAGRTDAGVHAWGQVVSGQLPASTDLDRLTRSINRLCGPEIVVRRAQWVDDNFSARFSATQRAYRYDVWDAIAPHPLRAANTWFVPRIGADGPPRPLDLEAMNGAADHLLGEHDFSSFCRRPDPRPGGDPPSLVRRVVSARWMRVDVDEADDGGRLVRFEVAATSFCHQMVRSIVGTLVDVGRGRIAAAAMPQIVMARDRAAAGAVAPPTGLTLWSVAYSGTRWDAG